MKRRLLSKINKAHIVQNTIAIFLFIVAFSVYATPNIPINFDGWVIDTLNKLELSGVTGGFDRHTLPLSREDVVKIIQTAEKRLQSGVVSISDIDRKLLEKLKREFHKELAELNHQDSKNTVLQRTDINIQPEIRFVDEKIAPALQSGLHFSIGSKSHRLNVYSELEISNFETRSRFC